MKKTIKITVPNDWAEVTLQKYLDLQRDLKNYADDEEATTAVLLHHLCNIEVEYVNQLPIDMYDILRSDISKFLNDTEYQLKRFITIDGIEYGFEPNLSKMSYGAYLDITKFDTLTIDENWAKIMSILYRPIDKKMGENYSIQAYEGNLDEKKFLNVTMDVHFGALNFFFSLLGDLLKGTLNSLKVEELPPNIKSILEKSGEITQRLLNLQMRTSLK